MPKPFVYAWRDAIADCSVLTTSERAIAWRLADYADPAGGSVRPGHARIAREVGFKVAPDAVKHDVVGRAIRHLIKLQLLVEVSSGHRGRAALYQLVLPKQ